MSEHQARNAMRTAHPDEYDKAIRADLAAKARIVKKLIPADVASTGIGEPETAALHIEWWPIDKPIPYDKNPRLPSDKSVAKVAASIKEFGWRQCIVVDQDGVIVAGHKRLLAAKQLGLGAVPVHVAHDLTPGQAKAYRLMDNRAQEDSEWDLDLLASEMGELKVLEMDLALTGFEKRQINEFLAQAGAPDATEEADSTPDVPAEPKAVPGDLWLCGPHRVLCGDSTVATDVERALGGAAPKLMTTDPPYGISLDGEWRDRAGLNGGDPNRTRIAKQMAKANPMCAAEPNYMQHRTEGHKNTLVSGDTRADWSDAFILVGSLEVAYVWHASSFTTEVLAGLVKIGFLYPQQIIWNKGRTVLTRTHYWYQHEPCWYVRKKNAPWFGKAGENSTIWDAPSPKFIMGSSDEEKFDHPTQKPVSLFTKPILNHTMAGEAVYEPFLGSGTTLMACEMTQRVCCGIELDPKFIEVIVRRWQSFTGQKATLEGDGRTFDDICAGRK